MFNIKALIPAQIHGRCLIVKNVHIMNRILGNDLKDSSEWPFFGSKCSFLSALPWLCVFSSTLPPAAGWLLIICTVYEVDLKFMILCTIQPCVLRKANFMAQAAE